MEFYITSGTPDYSIISQGLPRFSHKINQVLPHFISPYKIIFRIRGDLLKKANMVKYINDYYFIVDVSPSPNSTLAEVTCILDYSKFMDLKDCFVLESSNAPKVLSENYASYKTIEKRLLLNANVNSKWMWVKGGISTNNIGYSSDSLSDIDFKNTLHLDSVVRNKFLPNFNLIPHIPSYTEDTRIEHYLIVNGREIRIYPENAKMNKYDTHYRIRFLEGSPYEKARLEIFQGLQGNALIYSEEFDKAVISRSYNTGLLQQYENSNRDGMEILKTIMTLVGGLATAVFAPSLAMGLLSSGVDDLVRVIDRQVLYADLRNSRPTLSGGARFNNTQGGLVTIYAMEKHPVKFTQEYVSWTHRHRGKNEGDLYRFIPKLTRTGPGSDALINACKSGVEF